MDLEEALGQFDRTETNLKRLEAVWERLQGLTPSGVAFPGAGPDELEYDELLAAFNDIAAGVPAIDGVGLDAEPLTLNEIAQGRMDANELSEVEPLVAIEQAIEAPTYAIADYRHRFAKKRKQLVRNRISALVSEVDAVLAGLTRRHAADATSVGDDPEWQQLVAAIKEIERLLGQDLVRKGRWSDLTRHMSFAMGVDLHDIANADWPSVRSDIDASLYGELEPLPVETEDLAALADARPSGPVSTALHWEGLDAGDFERLLFNLFNDAGGYENPKWLMKTRAPDRGRDLSVDRVLSDSLTGVTRQRVIVQCKHWLSKSVGPTECAAAVTSALLWEPPPVDTLIIATSGRFTSDAVQWVERHNERRERPPIELWPESHLELLLAPRSALVTEFRLRNA